MILVTETSFKRAFKRLIKKNPHLNKKIFDTLDILANDPFTPSLKSHKLTGQIVELFLLEGKILKVEII